MELRDGVPAHLRTLVAVPTLLTTHEAIEEQIERLEIHYLASPDGDLHFALLSDWVDAATEHAEGDAALLQAADGGHRPAQPALWRRRRAAPASCCCTAGGCGTKAKERWIGWERKRGKLHELNRLLRGADRHDLPVDRRAHRIVPADVRYVITLDADTRLPRDTVHRLIGKMAHPLNRPRFDADAGRVVEGYAVLQPRVTPSLPVGREGSLFQRVFSGMQRHRSLCVGGLRRLSGSVRRRLLRRQGHLRRRRLRGGAAGRVPDSTLLSHDLFEGIFARAGLASDIEVVEEFPARYDVAALRQHRWARGDWQLLPWIFGRGPIAAARSQRGAIPAIGRWKMLDNLRRTLSAPAAVSPCWRAGRCRCRGR